MCLRPNPCCSHLLQADFQASARKVAAAESRLAQEGGAKVGGLKFCCLRSFHCHHCCCFCCPTCRPHVSHALFPMPNLQAKSKVNGKIDRSQLRKELQAANDLMVQVSQA